MKKLIVFALIIVLALSVCGCNNNKPTTPITEPPIVREPMGTVESAVLFHDNAIKITVLSLEQSSYGGEFIIQIENNSDRNIAFASDDLVVNGITITDGYSISCKSGQTAEGLIRVSYDSMDIAGMSNIAWISSPDARIFDTDTYIDICEAAIEIIKTSLYDSYSYSIPQQGTVCYEDDSITVTALGITNQSASSKVRLLITNKKDDTITLKVNNIVVDDNATSAWMFDTVYAGTSRYCEFTIDGKITELSFTLQVYGIRDNYVMLYETDKTTISQHN